MTLQADELVHRNLSVYLNEELAQRTKKQQFLKFLYYNKTIENDQLVFLLARSKMFLRPGTSFASMNNGMLTSRNF